VFSDQFHLRFNPDIWTPAGKFLQFLGEPYKNTRQLQKAIQSCIDHTRKYEIFAEIAAEVAPKIALDKAELRLNGFSPANHAKQFAAIVEVLVCELYSILDGIRYSTFEIYNGKVRGVQSKSTSKLFSKAAEKAYGEGFPTEIETMLTEAFNSWLPELRRLRTAFTHGGLGSCWQQDDSSKISYMNSSLGSENSAHIIEDIVAHVNGLAIAVFTLARAFFDHHYNALHKIASEQFCGFYKGRGYMRKVKPESNLHWGSGVCTSKEWFENEPEFMCPLASKCAAYARVA
jgi:hypothetical protein